MQKQPPIGRLDNRPDIGILVQQVKRSVHFGLEVATQSRKFALVVPGGNNQFVQGRGVKLDPHP